MSYTTDLDKAQWWHEAALAYSRSIPGNFTAIMVGWIGDSVPSVGIVRNDIIEKLEWAYNNRTIDQGWLGEHECEICNTHTDRGEILIIDGDRMYVAPKMILHYIKDHSYHPPEEFINALNKINVP